ncbi:hypothetical protein H0O01_02940 [Candidatus Micrarchaeota archaeon]|nr:hypothetical protein [Candidatus Micrarchaeota archaeon]
MGIFRSLQQRGIEKRQKLVDELQGLGFGIIDDSRLCKKGEIILNRGLNSPDSNFCVFIKTSFFGRTKVFFTDPSKGEGGKALSKRELMRRFSSFRVSDAWAEKVKDEVLDVQKAKDPNTRFVVPHGHWGENEGKDDGASSRINIIREMLLWHYDIDATGYHNHVIPKHIREIAELERRCGILKVPSIELTLPHRNPDSSNGPHMNIYFSSLETASSFYGMMVDRLVREFPGMAPVMERKKLLGRISDMRARNELALGIAHPYGETQLGAGVLSMGIINELDAGESLQWLFDFIRKYADMVAIYNPTFSNSPVSFSGRLISEDFFRGIVTKYVGTTAKMTQNNITYAFSLHCRHTFGKRNYFDHDTHVYSGVPFYWRMASPLSYGRLVIHFDEKNKERAREVFAKKDFTSSEFVQVLRKGSFSRNGCEIPAKVSYDAFVELDGGKLLPMKARRSLLRKMVLLTGKARQGLQYVKMFWQEAKRRLKLWK